MSLPTKEEVQTYLNETNTEALLQDALNKTIQERPANVAGFLAKHFQSDQAPEAQKQNSFRPCRQLPCTLASIHVYH